MRVVDPERRLLAHVQVHERAVRVVAAADVAERPAVVADDLVRHPQHAKVDRLADVVVRVGRVLKLRIRAEAADDLDLPASEMVRDRREEVDQARLDRVGKASHRTHHLFRRLRDRGGDLPAPGVHVKGELLAAGEPRHVHDVGRLRPHRVRDRLDRLAIRAAFRVRRVGPAPAGPRGLHARDRQRLADLEVARVLEVIGVEDRLHRDVVPVRDRLDRVPARDDVLHVGIRVAAAAEDQQRSEREREEHGQTAHSRPFIAQFGLESRSSSSGGPPG